MKACLVTQIGGGRTIEVPLTGEPEHDALLERLARKGGPTYRHEGNDDPADREARAAMREGQ